jgi:hypothetical protein
VSAAVGAEEVEGSTSRQTGCESLPIPWTLLDPQPTPQESDPMTQKSITPRRVGSFRSPNAESVDADNLRSFLARVDAGDVPSGTVAIVEDLDRLARRSPVETLRLLKRLLDRGILIRIDEPPALLTNPDDLDELIAG